MAQITIMVGGEVVVNPLFISSDEYAVQSIDIAFDLPGSGYPYDRTNLSLHGTPKEILRFSEAIVASVRASKTVKEFQAERAIAAEGLDAAGMNE